MSSQENLGPAKGVQEFEFRTTYTPASAVPSIVAEIRKNHATGTTLNVKYRKSQMKRLFDFLDENEEALIHALHLDLHKPRAESLTTEILFVRKELSEAFQMLDEWAQPKQIKDLPLSAKTDTAYIRSEPIGVACIIGAWNYPIQLLLAPFVGALSAGTSCILKPSELSPHVASLLTTLLPRYLDARHYRVLLGETIETTTAILDQGMDLVFYTGGGRVARVIAERVAKHLTPCVFELGGKSPAVVLPDAKDLATVSKRLCWGRFTNAGQTCVAPDFVVCPTALYPALITELKKTIVEFYGSDPKTTADYARMASGAQFRRVLSLIPDGNGSEEDGKVECGGREACHEGTLYIPPTVLSGVGFNGKVMQEEIFGPVLPVIAYDSLDDVLGKISAMDKPLALYVFGGDKDKESLKTVLDRVQSGGVTVNDVLMHITVSQLPFGGVGPSGCGSYHGRKSFETFSHLRSVLERPAGLEQMLSVRYPPYTAEKEKVTRWLVDSKLDGSGKGLPPLRALGAATGCNIL